MKVRDALKEVRLNGKPFPQALSDLGPLARRGRTQEEIEAQWDSLSFEEKVDMVACAIGPQMSPEPNAVITKAYDWLCQNQKLPVAAISEDEQTFDVHYTAEVRISFKGVKASSAEEAFKIVD